MLNQNIVVIQKNGINYISQNGKIQKLQPWLGDLFAFLYDSIMKKTVFPKKFEASIEDHTRFLKDEFQNIHHSIILELATGSGNMAEFLPPDNQYVGIDISEGLLKIASHKFIQKGFDHPEFYICSADDLPFQDNIFDLCICNLSLNFFNDLDHVIKQIKRSLKPRGYFVCSIPVPERNHNQSTIRGKLFPESGLKEIFEKHGFDFSSYAIENGALLYF